MNTTERLVEAEQKRRKAKERLIEALADVARAKQRVVCAEEEHAECERNVTMLTLRKEREGGEPYRPADTQRYTPPPFEKLVMR